MSPSRVSLRVGWITHPVTKPIDLLPILSELMGSARTEVPRADDENTVPNPRSVQTQRAWDAFFARPCTLAPVRTKSASCRDAMKIMTPGAP